MRKAASPVEIKDRPTSRQIVRQQPRKKPIIGDEPTRDARLWIAEGGVGRRITSRRETGRVERRIRQARLKALREPRRRLLKTDLDRLGTSRVRQRRLAARVRQRPVLRQRVRLVIEQVCTGVVLDDVATDPRIQLDNGVIAQGSRERGRHIETMLVLPLVLPRALLIKGIGRLEAGTGGKEIELKTRLGGQTRVEPVKEVVDVAVRVERVDLGCVEESATVQSAGGTPVITSSDWIAFPDS